MSDMAIWVVFYKEQSGRGVPKYGNMSDMAIWVVFYKEQSGGGFQIWQYGNMTICGWYFIKSSSKLAGLDMSV